MTGNSLDIEDYLNDSDDIVEGRLIDHAANTWYRIENGIADLVPLHLRRVDKYDAFCQRHRLDIASLRAAEKPVDKGYANQIRFFAEYQEKYEEEVVQSPFYKLLDEITLGAWIKRTLKAGDLVVEIACGSGRQSVPLTQHGCRVVGLDLSEEMLLVARRKILSSGGSADFVVASADALPLAAAAFDSAVIYGSLHHFPDAQTAIAEAVRVMRNGASFYMLEPHDSALRPIFDWSMKLCTLWEEEAHDEPLFSRKQFETWLMAGNIEPRVSYSTYLPPHIFHITGRKLGRALLKGSDTFFGNLPGIRKLAGVIIAEGRKRT